MGDDEKSVQPNDEAVKYLSVLLDSEKESTKYLKALIGCVRSAGVTQRASALLTDQMEFKRSIAALKAQIETNGDPDE